MNFFIKFNHFCFFARNRLSLGLNGSCDSQHFRGGSVTSGQVPGIRGRLSIVLDSFKYFLRAYHFFFFFLILFIPAVSSKAKLSATRPVYRAKLLYYYTTRVFIADVSSKPNLESKTANTRILHNMEYHNMVVPISSLYINALSTPVCADANSSRGIIPIHTIYTVYIYIYLLGITERKTNRGLFSCPSFWHFNKNT